MPSRIITKRVAKKLHASRLRIVSKEILIMNAQKRVGNYATEEVVITCTTNLKALSQEILKEKLTTALKTLLQTLL